MFCYPISVAGILAKILIIVPLISPDQQRHLHTYKTSFTLLSINWGLVATLYLQLDSDSIHQPYVWFTTSNAHTVTWHTAVVVKGNNGSQREDHNSRVPANESVIWSQWSWCGAVRISIHLLWPLKHYITQSSTSLVGEKFVTCKHKLVV